MSEIEVRGLRKEYRVHERKAGLGAAVRSFFSRQYRTVTAVDGIDFSIEKGARVGFLGPNGAGKTTTLKMLAGLLHPTAGSVRVGGFVPSAREVAFLSRITLVMGQKQQLLWDLPPLETFDLNRAIYQVPRAQAAETIRRALGAPRARRSGEEAHPRALAGRADEVRAGGGARASADGALLGRADHRPRRVHAEPPCATSSARTPSATAPPCILTSHDMDDVSALCPRILVIDKGALSYDGALTGLVHEVRPEKRVHVSLEASCPREILEALAARSSAKLLSLEGASATFQVDKVRLAELTRSLLAELSVQDLEITSAPLEEVMSELFRRTKSARAPSEDEREP
jgi:ABC-2 type transport system ATP-binding protein